jgi:hypothetical protein
VLGAGSACKWKGFAPRSHCESPSEDVSPADEGRSIIEQADAQLEESKARVKTPMQFETLKLTLNAGRVNAFDGLRFYVSKQVNLNTAVSHL